jgi:hypothetical protein
MRGWYRRGGRRISVHVTAAELAGVVAASLPAGWGPWHSTGADGHPPRPWAADGVDLARDLLDPDGRQRFEVYLWSARLTSARPPSSAPASYETRCGWNGFLLLQNFAGPVVAPTGHAYGRDVTMVDALYTPGGLVAYPHYLSVWRRIAARLRKLATRRGPPHGHPLWSGDPWSEAALAEAAAHVPGSFVIDVPGGLSTS